MDIFLSSVIDGFEEFRTAAAQAATDLGHTVVRAEGLGASPSSPRRTCLAEARNAGAVILILGERYGLLQPSGLSPTHEEYREAREEDKVLAFIQTGVAPEPSQQALINEVVQWEGGHYVSHFATAADLRSAVTGALHRLELAREAGVADEAEVLARSVAGLAAARSYSTTLELIVAGGPRRAVIRPGDLAASDLADWLAETAVTGATRLFPISGSGNTAVAGSVVSFAHQRGGVSMDELGTIAVIQDLHPPRDRSFRSGLTPVIHEHVEERLVTAIRFVSAALDRLDPVARISTVVPVARLTGGIGAWMSRAEAEANRNGAMSLNARTDAPAVHLTPSGRRRASLSADAAGIARDLAARLREVALAGRGMF